MAEDGKTPTPIHGRTGEPQGPLQIHPVATRGHAPALPDPCAAEGNLSDTGSTRSSMVLFPTPSSELSGSGDVQVFDELGPHGFGPRLPTAKALERDVLPDSLTRLTSFTKIRTTTKRLSMTEHLGLNWAAGPAPACGHAWPCSQRTTSGTRVSAHHATSVPLRL